MEIKKLDQSSGDQCVNIQADNVHIGGVSLSEARQIAEEVVERNIYRLAGKAHDLVEERVEQLREEFISQLCRTNPAALNSMGDPDMQYGFAKAQIAHARSGNRDMREILVQVLVKRATEDSRTLRQVVLNESLDVIPKLTTEQLDTLSVIFAVRHMFMPYLEGWPDFISHFAKLVLPFLTSLSSEPIFYRHLQYAGTVVLNEVAFYYLPHKYVEQYPGLFCEGFSKELLDTSVGIDAIRPDSIVPCVNSPHLWQFDAITKKDFEELLSRVCRISTDDPTRKKVAKFHKDHLMGKDEASSILGQQSCAMGEFLELWTNSKIQNCSLTSVGILIGIANIERKTGVSLDLSIWIP